ncbi:HD domain-containing protein [Crocinitomix catalasitica]|uniref:HD domain-containing protein n=1 Tax=Crocinitomix catalasitica TaxID=184607 RepID=UPI000ACC642D|nr:HD domain-containing protein [Crocinitomix catalasitica]
MKLSDSQMDVVGKLKAHIKNIFEKDASGHDWFHIERVYKNALSIHKIEGGDLFIISLSALLHDIADHKFNDDAQNLAIERIHSILIPLKVDQAIIDKVIYIVQNSSYKGGLANEMNCLEGLIVQDADRLDAIGAIGIARTFAFGGKFNRLLYDPSIEPVTFKSLEELKTSKSHTINHFYEKLLKLKDGMHTKTGLAMAEQRHVFMEQFLSQFFAEWNGKK